MKNINTKNKCAVKKMSVGGGSVPPLKKAAFSSLGSIPMTIEQLIDEYIVDCASQVARQQELLDGFKALRKLLQSIQSGSNEEKALLSMLGLY